MFTLIALIVIGIWGGIGFVIWRFLILPHLRSPMTKICVTFILALLWFVGPVIDEILGAREFDQLCREMPSIKFYGPASVGPGAFFDEQGRPMWKNRDEFSAIKRSTSEWKEKIFEIKDEYGIIRRWPMGIRELHTIYFDKTTGKPVIETFARYSDGGWLSRLIGMTYYQCPSRGNFPRDEEMIIFKAK